VPMRITLASSFRRRGPRAERNAVSSMRAALPADTQADGSVPVVQLILITCPLLLLGTSLNLMSQYVFDIARPLPPCSHRSPDKPERFSGVDCH
jgi:hypothetical protein